METRARYVLIGLFVLAAIGGGLRLRLLAAQHRRPRRAHRLPHPVREFRGRASLPARRFCSTASASARLPSSGSFPTDPREVTVTDRGRAQHADPRRHAGRDISRGLTGSPTVALIGGAPTAPPLAGAERAPPLLIAEPNAGQDVMQAARDVIRRLDKLVAENSDSLRNAIANIDTFTDALARNSDKVDAIAEGLVRMTGGGAGKGPAHPLRFDRTRAFPGLAKLPDRPARRPEPTATLGLDTQRILVQRGPGRAAGFRGRAMERQPSEALSGADRPELRERPVSASRSRRAKRHPRISSSRSTCAISVSSRRPNRSPRSSSAPRSSAREGASCRRGFFSATAPAKGVNAQAAAEALDAAFQKAVTELVIWTAATL